MIVSSLTPLLPPSSGEGRACAADKVNRSHFKRFVLFVVNCYNTAKKTAASFLAPCRPSRASDARKMRGAKLRVGRSENKAYTKHFIKSRAYAIEESKAWCMSEIAKINIPKDFLNSSTGDGEWDVVTAPKDLEKIGNSMMSKAAEIFTRLKKDYFEYWVNFEEVPSSRIRALAAHYSVPRPSFNDVINGQPHEQEYKKIMLAAYDNISDALIGRLAGTEPGAQAGQVSEYSLGQHYLSAFRDARIGVFRTFSSVAASSEPGLTRMVSRKLIQEYDAAFQREVALLRADPNDSDAFLNKLVRAHQSAELPQDFFQCSQSDIKRLNESLQAAAPPPLLLAKMAIKTIGALKAVSNLPSESMGLSTSA
jgi:hypothetical protein